MKLGNFIALCVLAAACGGGTPTNFAGTYSITVTNQANNCSLTGWTDGTSTSGIPATMTQDGTTAQINVQGLVGLYLVGVIGSSSIQGTVSGNTFTGEYLGTKHTQQGACDYTYNAKIVATLDANNVMSGTITYTPITNGDPSCGILNTCNNVQTVAGTRSGP
jgi:hypothetical protein